MDFVLNMFHGTNLEQGNRIDINNTIYLINTCLVTLTLGNWHHHLPVREGNSDKNGMVIFLRSRSPG